MSTFIHWDPSAGCRSIRSCLRSSLCHRINLACALFLNKRFKRGSIRKYDIILAGIFSWWYYREIPHNLSGEFFLSWSIYVTSIVLPDLISLCTANRTSIQFLIFITAIKDTVIRICMNLLYIQSKRANNLFCFVLSRAVRYPREACSL
jgi:hypothetical protein